MAASRRSTRRRPLGAPTKYDDEVVRELCRRLADGETVRQISASDPRMPKRSVINKWLHDGKHEAFVALYAEARLAQADTFAEDLINIADASQELTATGIMAARLRFDARRWAASRINPRRWGDKQQHEITGADGAPLAVDVRKSLLEKLRAVAERAGGDG